MQFPKVGRGYPERVQGSGLKCGVTGPVAISVSTPTLERSRVPGAGATYFWELHPRQTLPVIAGLMNINYPQFLIMQMCF